jgi:hypothetical protein
MKTEEIRELKLLTDISSGDTAITQRSLARTHGVALGLTNLLIRRLAKKGFIKITHMKGKHLRYLITPQGIAEKTRLTYQYIHYSLYYYRQIRQFLSRSLSAFAATNRRNILLIGTGEVAEIAYLTVRELGLNLTGFIDGRAANPTFLNYAVHSFEDLPHLSFDAAIIASLQDRSEVYGELLRANVREEDIVAVPETFS